MIRSYLGLGGLSAHWNGWQASVDCRWLWRQLRLAAFERLLTAYLARIRLVHLLQGRRLLLRPIGLGLLQVSLSGAVRPDECGREGGFGALLLSLAYMWLVVVVVVVEFVCRMIMVNDLRVLRARY